MESQTQNCKFGWKKTNHKMKIINSKKDNLKMMKEFNWKTAMSKGR